MTQHSSSSQKPPARKAIGPVLKWAGGKSRLLGPILDRLPSTIGTYYEPFVGSGAVFFALAAQGRFQHAVLSDRNKELVDVYRALKRNVGAVIKALQQYHYDEETYYEVRAQVPDELELPARAARTIFLNKTGFNGLYRVNRSGAFNVPFGRHSNPKICNTERLRAAAKVLQNVKLEVRDFQQACAPAKEGDAVYFDPPYVPLSKTASFTAYSKYTFGEEDHSRLAEVFASLAKRKVTSVLSNSDTPLTQRLYSKWKPEMLAVTRPINSNSERRGPVSELLVSNIATPKRKR